MSDTGEKDDGDGQQRDSLEPRMIPSAEGIFEEGAAENLSLLSNYSSVVDNSEPVRNSNNSSDNLVDNCRVTSTAAVPVPVPVQQQHNSAAAAAARPESQQMIGVRRKFRSLTFGRRYKMKGSSIKEKSSMCCAKVSWNLRIRLKRLREKHSGAGAVGGTDIPDANAGCDACVCTGYRRTEEHHLGAGVVFWSDMVAAPLATAARVSANDDNESATSAAAAADDSNKPVAAAIYSAAQRHIVPSEIDDEIVLGFSGKPHRVASRDLCEALTVTPQDQRFFARLAEAFQSRLAVGGSGTSSADSHVWRPVDLSSDQGCSGSAESPVTCVRRTVHSQADYVHRLVPDLLEITKCSFYWGKMDRYEAERLLEKKPEGTFLLRDSAQEHYLFSVSFRRYERTLHARIEQEFDQFSFDSLDPGVYASKTVCGLIEHYKDPSCCMFFEPMLTIPLHRTFTFPLQHLCRAVICNATDYDGISNLEIPKTLKGYLKEYHYKQRVNYWRFDGDR